MEIDFAQLGQRVAKRRKVLNLTQDDLAEATGLSNNFISNIENNHSVPSIESLMKICSALNTTPDYLLLGILKSGDERLTTDIHERMKLCNNKKLNLILNFITWIVDEQIN
jgi:transcriptional regulator with XRE-family HTH domain